VPGLVQYGHDRSDRALIVELDRGNDSFPNPVIEIFKEDECSSLPCDGERIGVEVVSWIGKDVPAGP
jgi:hypothetical protein